MFGILSAAGRCSQRKQLFVRALHPKGESDTQAAGSVEPGALEIKVCVCGGVTLHSCRTDVVRGHQRGSQTSAQKLQKAIELSTNSPRHRTAAAGPTWLLA